MCFYIGFLLECGGGGAKITKHGGDVRVGT